MSRRTDRLSEEERVLWNLVARTAKPLKGKIAVPVPDLAAESKAAKPVDSSTLRIQSSTNRPSAMAPNDRVRPMALERRRFA